MHPRVTIAAVVGFVAFCGVGLAALRDPTELWASLLFTAALATVTATLLWARRSRSGLGFGAFGVVYLLTAFGPWPGNRATVPPLLPDVLANMAMDRIQGDNDYRVMDKMRDGTRFTRGRFVAPSGNGPPLPRRRIFEMETYRHISHCLGTVAFGLVGAVLGAFSRRKGASP